MCRCLGWPVKAKLRWKYSMRCRIVCGINFCSVPSIGLSRIITPSMLKENSVPVRSTRLAAHCQKIISNWALINFEKVAVQSLAGYDLTYIKVLVIVPNTYIKLSCLLSSMFLNHKCGRLFSCAVWTVPSVGRPDRASAALWLTLA